MDRLLKWDLRYSIILSIFLVFNRFIYTFGSQCALVNGECTYNVYLNNGNGECGHTVTSNERPWNINLESQSDDSGTGNLPVQREDQLNIGHESRIRELEASVQKLLRDAVPSEPRSNHIPEVVIGYDERPPRQRINRTENTLMSRLSVEFSNLRNNLQDKSLRLLDTQSQLNASNAAFMDAQHDLVEASESLILVEHRAGTLQQENYILKNQIKHRNSKLATASELLNITESKLREMEMQLYALVRSESNLKEELGYYQYQLNKTAQQFTELGANHTRLKNQQKRTLTELRTTENELMECYSGMHGICI